MVSSGSVVRLRVVRDLIARLRGLLEDLDPACLSPGQAVGLVEDLAALERLAGAGKTLAAGRAAQTGAWGDGTDRDFETWLAGVSGTTWGAARATVQTATRLQDLPATAAAFRAGHLSPVQAAAVADAAAADPAAERDLLESAARNGMKGLRDDCARVKAAASCREDELARYRRAVEGRSLRHFRDADGMGRIDVRGPIDQTARIMARLEPAERHLFEAARQAGERVRPDALAFDALLAVTTGAAPPDGEPGARRVGAELVVHVSHEAFRRGHTEPGETCEIAGVGPIPVAVAERLACDAILKALVVDGTDVLAVAHLGRTIPARLRTAIEARDRECVVAGCHATRHLEIDHNVPISEGGETSLGNCHALCHHHHDHKHRHEARLVGAPGHMTFEYPDGRGPPEGRGPP
jgi:hypothetical protein